MKRFFLRLICRVTMHKWKPATVAMIRLERCNVYCSRCGEKHYF